MCVQMTATVGHYVIAAQPAIYDVTSGAKSGARARALVAVAAGNVGRYKVAYN